MEIPQSQPNPGTSIPSPSPLLHPAVHASSPPSKATSLHADVLSTSRPPSLAPSGSHLSVNYGQRASRDPSILSRRSTRSSVRHVAATAAALISNPDARRIRQDLYSELVRGWYHLSTGSKALLAYYIGATVFEIAVTVTVAVLEREKARKCFYLLIFLGLYLLRSIVICGVLLRRFLYIRPDDLPRDISGACGAHYKTMINWASLILLLFSISLLTTQSHCAKESPGLFYLILAFSLLGYLCLAALLFLWIFVLFCFNGLMTVLELFGVGPRVMKWEGATQEMLDAIPIIKFSKPEEDTEVGAKTAQPGSGQDPSTSTVVGSSSPKNIASNIVTPSIVVVPDDPVEPHPASGSVVVDMEHSAGVLDRNKGASVNNTTGTEHDGGDASNTLPLENLNPEEQALDDQMSPSCAICLCDYEDLEELRHLPCDHIFHKDCVDEWLKLKRTCPLCKYDISHMRRGSRFWSRRGRRNGNTSSGSRGGSGSAGRFSIGSRR